MAGRQLCQWDKDSCADAGFLKIDLLGLGMLSAVEDCVEQIARDARRGDRPLAHPASTTRRSTTRSSARTRSARSRSRAARRCRASCGRSPENLDDLTVQVALVRPGPIQGKAVHPYIDARAAAARGPGVRLPGRPRAPARAAALDVRRRRLPGSGARGRDRARRLHGRRGRGAAPRDEPQAQPRRARGVPRALHRGRGGEGRRRGDRRPRLRQARRLLGLRLPEGARGRVRAARLPVDVAAPLLPGGVPVRAPERAADGLLPARDARARRAAPRGGGASRRRQPERALRVRRSSGEAVRIGLNYVASVGKDDAEALVAERDANGPYRDVADLARRSQLSYDGLEALVKGGACDGFWQPRRDLLWELGLVFRAQSRARNATARRSSSRSSSSRRPRRRALRDLTRWERMLADYRHTSLSVETHPLTLLRPHLPAGTLSSAELHAERHGRQVAFAGMTVARQRPSTAKGIVFMLLEDEHGQVNLIVPLARSTSGTARSCAPSRSSSRAVASSGSGENRNVLVSELESLGPLARRVAEDDTVWESLPRPHSFGHAELTPMPSGPCSDVREVRPQRRRRRRLPGRRRRADRPRLRRRLGHASRGVSGSCRQFRRYCERLGEFTRLILFDKRGMGMSDRVPGATTLEDAHGRHPRDHGRGRKRARGRDGRVGRRSARDAVRRRASRDERSR